jgi:hypothetical protein
VKELRARSRAGKERLARISEGAHQEWQGTMDGGKIPISQPEKKKKRRKRSQKHKGLESGGGSVASFFSVAPPSSPGSSSLLLPPLRRCYVGCSCICIGGLGGGTKCEAGLCRACLCSSCRHCALRL